ncbi:MAG TPA: STAS domain-containing protein [Actinocrinis sp.]|jgi:anti-anti-sigma factor|uniref:STAS domain-containing protein n=1 Tax=Actinocrinis sp. TaxID=1920516 RepID=UPI002DDD97D9|nr:STAS domain-containing protein [Actinocrinis sp.]HEV3172106.1 STAS domain-containing protein [Actinocrinis sp.]
MDVISTRRDEFLHVITVRGEVDLATAGDLLLRLLMLAGPATGTVALDLSQVAFIDCAGLRALTALDRHVRTRGGSVHVAVASLAVARLFELVGLHARPDCVMAPPDPAAALDGRSGVWPVAAA